MHESILLLKLDKFDIILLVIIMKTDLRKWMANIDDSSDLFRLTIPGTHDCVTQYVQLMHISNTQDKNIYEQLCIGIRALDIRVQSKGERLGMVHGIAKAFNNPNHFSKQMDLADVLSHCYNFLNKNPSESIIFQFKNDSNKENEKCFNNLFYTYIRGNENKWYTQNRLPSLKEARGKIVLIRRCKMDEKNPDFNSNNTGIDFSRWVEQDIAVPEALTLETHNENGDKFVIQDRFKYKPQERWDKCLKPFLDSMAEFNGTYVINYTSTAGGLKGPKYNASIINPLFMEYPLAPEKYYGTIYLDFPTAQLTRKIIEHNRIIG